MALILASTSAIRRHMLDAAGIGYCALSPEVDEDRVKRGFVGDDSALARALAEAKAVAGSGLAEPGNWVIGADSIVSVAGRRYSKPADRDDAAAHLRAFSGQTMELTSAVALARDGTAEWTHAGVARLEVRELSERFIADYLDAEWPEVGYCVGVFRLEGRGVTLFDTIDGDHFTILGMPLLALLGALRERGLIER